MVIWRIGDNSLSVLVEAVDIPDTQTLGKIAHEIPVNFLGICVLYDEFGKTHSGS